MKYISKMTKFLYLIFIFSISGIKSDEYIEINKKNVLYKFVSFDKPTDHFVKNVFPNWEMELFDVFEKVKDPLGIAIDIGAWIGVTTIWLAKNFSDVIAIDADRVSLQCLKNNLKASECTNVLICENALADKNKDVIFGARGSQKLNDSMSCIKEQAYNVDDYIVKAITFKQLLSNYIYNNEQLRSKKITFIKCDIEGGEENIIADMLSFAYQNKTMVYLSFHLDWWTSKKITDFESLFKLFATSCPQSDICKYIKENPFTSIFFAPLEGK